MMKPNFWVRIIPVLCCSAAWAQTQTQPQNPALADLARGIAAYQRQDYAAAAASLGAVRIPQLADYVAYYLAAARVEAKDCDGIGTQLAPVHQTQVPSPLAGKARLLEARALQAGQPADAVKLLRERYAELPQPDGNLALAQAYEAANDPRQAVEFYQRVNSEYVTGDAALAAQAALEALKARMGSTFPRPLPEQALQRAGRLLEARQFRAAKTEYESSLDLLTGVARDQARVRIGQADLQEGNAAVAMTYLRALQLPDSEADAERLYWQVECARGMNDEAAMMQAVASAAAKYPRSPWRLKATVSAANRWLSANRPDQYLPLYRAAYEGFPENLSAGLYHWKVAFYAYLHDQADAPEQLRDQLRTYSNSPQAGAALYFLGRYSERQKDFGYARACYERLARALPNQFYAMLARQRLQQNEVARAPESKEAALFLASFKLPEAAPLPAAETRPTALRIERSRLLRAAGLNDLADGELRFGARAGGQPVLLGMEMAEKAESPYQALRAMKAWGGDYLNRRLDQAPRRFWEMLFPLPYRSQLEGGARAQGVDPFLLAGLIRQESEFNPVAVSRANALGLTQVLPGTARQFAHKAGVPRPTPQQLFEPGISLKIGSAVLRSMLDQHGGRLEQTLAAYNAGPRRMAEWATWGTYREPAEFIEMIPFTETREYVQAVLRNADIYRRLYH